MATQREILELLMRTSGEADVAALREAIDQLGRQSDDAAGQAGKLEGELNRLAGVASDVAKAVTLKGALNETTAQLEAAQKGLADLNAEFSATDRSSPAVNRAFKSAEKAVADLTARQREQQLELTRTTNGLQKAGVDTDNLAKEYDRLEAEIRQSTVATADQAKQLTASQQAAKQLAERYEQLSGSLRSAAGRVNEIAGNMVKLGAAAGAALAGLAAFGAARFFQAGLQDAAAFESALGRIQAAGNLSAEQIDALKGEIEDIGLDASKGVLEAAAAFEQLTREGLNAADAQAQLRTALDFATAAKLDTAEAVRLIGDATGAFSVAASESARVADVLVAGALKAGQAVGEYTAQIKSLGPAAADADLSLTETAAIIARLAQSGIEGGRAVGAFAQVLGALRDPSSAFAKELDKLGIQTRDFNQVLVELGQRGPAAEAALLALGDRGTLVLRALAQDGGAALEQLRRDLENSGGAATKAAATINDDYDTALKRLSESFSVARSNLAAPLLGPLADEIDKVARSIRAFTKSPEYQRIQTEIPKLFAAGSEAVKEFIRDVDLNQVADQIASFAENAGERLRGFASDVGDVKDFVIGTARAISVVVNAFQTFINGAATLISGVLQAGAQLDLTMARLRVASAGLVGSTEDQVEAAENLRRATIVANGLAAATRENYKALQRNIEETSEAFGRFAEGVDFSGNAAQAALDRQAEAARKAIPAIEDLTKVTDAYDKAVNEAAAAGEANAAAIAKQGAAAGAASAGVQKAAAAAGDAAKANDEAASASASAASAATATASANRQVADSAAQAADETQDQAAAAKEAEQSMNDLALALFETSEEGLRAYMDANRAAIVSAREFASRVNEVTARIREQEDAASAYLASLSAQSTGTDELSAAVERLRRQYSLLSDARLREIAQAEIALQRQRDALLKEVDAIDARRARSGAELAAQRQREIDAELKRLAEIERQLSFRDQRERDIIAARRRELEAERAAVERNADARVEAELGADRRIREAREAEARASAQAAATPAAAGMVTAPAINITINGVMASDRREFARQIAPELETVFRRLDYLRR